MTAVAILFARRDSIYKKLHDCDVFDIDRDARTFAGGMPVVAHPPCRAWGGLRHMAKPRADERELSIFAVDQVRRWGGVLEHPRRSQLWPVLGLPNGIQRDEFGGFTLPIYQSWFGHRADKATLLYIVGCEPTALPAFPLRLGNATHVVGTGGRRIDGRRLQPGDATFRPEISKSEREHTPHALAAWLVEVARRSAHSHVQVAA